MPNDVEVKVFFDFQADRYKFLITTPDIKYFVTPYQSMYSEMDEAAAVNQIKLVNSFKIATVVTSAAMIYDWHMVVDHVTNTVARELHLAFVGAGGVDDYVVRKISEEVRYILMLKPPSVWVEEAQSASSYGGSGMQSKLRQLVPGLKERVACPACDTLTTELWSIIQHINDNHKWSRGAIADWLETLDVDIEFKVQDD